MIESLIWTILSTVVSSVLLVSTQRFFEFKKIFKEEKEIKEEVEKVYKTFEEKDNQDVLHLMIQNVAELREYYVINKQQARNSFSAALFISILGFLLFASGFVLSYTMPDKSDIIPYSTVGGSIIEIIAGLFFWLYSKAIRQINIFHTSLQSTEKFLTAIQLVDKVSIDKKDDIYREIISKIINSNFAASQT
ncbi:hypothetical protein [Flavobacterium sp.]|uniref:TRADD-N-associated membrane domain-containing protein n=1 Tax=Flavobacterium sp. TaxID=239 RepID=UPI0025BCDA8C|nr:hypothetical protein [Flavobacterium sp.]